MKRYHITYYLENCGDSPVLTGITIEAESMIFAINTALHTYNVKESLIKYCIEL